MRGRVKLGDVLRKAGQSFDTIHEVVNMRHLILVTLLSVATMPCGFAQSSAPEPKVMAAVDGVLEAFTAYPVVALGDSHGMAQEEDFYAALVRSPRFATEVGNVVVEFGDAAQQHTLDRYLSGEEIPYPELRKVWADTVGWLPTVTSLGYINFYAQVRKSTGSCSQSSRFTCGWVIPRWTGRR